MSEGLSGGWLSAIALGLVEGLSEFLPISSTGHLIIAAHWLGENSESAKLFEVVIQLGAVLAVCWEIPPPFVEHGLRHRPAKISGRTTGLCDFSGLFTRRRFWGFYCTASLKRICFPQKP